MALLVGCMGYSHTAIHLTCALLAACMGYCSIDGLYGVYNVCSMGGLYGE